MAQLDWSQAVAPTPAPVPPMKRLHIDRTFLIDETGQALRLRGVNVCSLEFDRDGANWKLGTDGSALLATLRDAARWHANVVRVPVNQQWFVEDDSYVQRVESIIDDANRRGLYVLLDVQWELGRKLDPYWDNILKLPTFGPGNTTEAFWHKASSRWANRTNLLYDLINEPHGHDAETTARAMQVLVDAIRQRDTLAVIVVGGMDWAHTVDHYRTHPLKGPNLLYSAHQYLPWDDVGGFARRFGNAAKKVPVIIGEFIAEQSTLEYAQKLVSTAESEGVNGWLPWAIGCGFDETSDQSVEPLKFLAAKMRELNP